MRIRAPEPHGRGGWIGAVARAPILAGLRGTLVLHDLWTLCCVNCRHVLAQLRPLEQPFVDVLVVSGVPSPRFPHGVGHPVLGDSDPRTWQQYAVRAWPTPVVIDPGPDRVCGLPPGPER